MLKKKIVIIAIIFSALLVGIGVSFAFGNIINPNCPDEIKQAIQNWDKGLDERDALNQPQRDRGTEGQSKKSFNSLPVTRYSSLRTLFLTSLVTLTFNTPVHSQILVSNFIQKLFAVAKHYFNLPAYPLTRLPAVIFTIIKRYFEKIFLLFLGLILPVVCCFTLTHLLTYSLTHRLYYQFHNLRL